MRFFCNWFFSQKRALLLHPNSALWSSISVLHHRMQGIHTSYPGVFVREEFPFLGGARPNLLSVARKYIPNILRHFAIFVKNLKNCVWHLKNTQLKQKRKVIKCLAHHCLKNQSVTCCSCSFWASQGAQKMCRRNLRTGLGNPGMFPCTVSTLKASWKKSLWKARSCNVDSPILPMRFPFSFLGWCYSEPLYYF